jgi:carotenoid cleavage dioxygenase-like enzyme
MDGLDAPVADESTFLDLDLEVEGTLPPDLSGSYLRIGPNPIGGDPSRDDGMVHRVTLRAGRAVSYRNRWITTDATSAALGVEPVPGPGAGPVDGASDGLLLVGGRLLAVSAGSLAYELEPDRLDTLRRVDLVGRGRGIGARAVTDPATGDQLVLAAPGTTGAALHRLGAGGRAGRCLHAPVPVHDLVAAGDAVIVLGVGALAVVSDGPVRWLDAPDIHERVVVLGDGRGDGSRTVLTASHVHGLERWTIPPAGREVAVETVDPTPLAHATTDPAGRFVVATAADGRAVLRHDRSSGSTTRRPLGAGIEAGELRVAGPDGRWLVGFAQDRAAACSRFVVVDRRDLTLVGSVRLPRRVPAGRQGLWI